MPNLLLQKDSAAPWFYKARFDAFTPEGKQFKDELKAFPGVAFETNDFGSKYWLVPAELRETVGKLGRKFGFECPPETPRQPPQVTLFNSLGKFEPFQKPDIEKLLDLISREEAALVAYAMGLGKTPIAIELARQLANGLKWKGYELGGGDPPEPQFDILIICPAMARGVWQYGNGPEFKDNGFARWWPARYTREVWRGREYTTSPRPIIHAGADTGPYSLSKWVAQSSEDSGNGRIQGRAVVCSYGILRSLLESLGGPNPPAFSPRLIILDEAHYISSPTSAQSKAVFHAAQMFPDARRLALTGTPLTNPDDLAGLHTVLDWLWPGRFGTKGAFKFHYMNPVEAFDKKDNFRGYKYEGLNKANKEELRSRLAACSARLTKKDVAHLLPPFSCNLVQFDGARYNKAVELSLDLLRQGHDHIRVACWTHSDHNSAAKELIRAFQKAKTETPVFLVSGAETPEQRTDTLAQARKAPKSITIATIDSTKVAIDLTFQTASVYAELSYKIEAILQNLGRGHRASSTRGHDVFILADEQGDPLATALYRKATILSEILSAGTEEQALTDTLASLKVRGLDQADIDEMLALVRYGEDDA